MTEEDQKLVALAALHGCRFRRIDDGSDLMWSYEGSNITKWTVGRAAELYLWKHEMRSDAEHYEYDGRTNCEEVQEIDPEFLASVLA